MNKIHENRCEVKKKNNHKRLTCYWLFWLIRSSNQPECTFWIQYHYAEGNVLKLGFCSSPVNAYSLFAVHRIHVSKRAKKKKRKKKQNLLLSSSSSFLFADDCVYAIVCRLPLYRAWYVCFFLLQTYMLFILFCLKLW